MRFIKFSRTKPLPILIQYRYICGYTDDMGYHHISYIIPYAIIIYTNEYGSRLMILILILFVYARDLHFVNYFGKYCQVNYTNIIQYGNIYHCNCLNCLVYIDVDIIETVVPDTRSFYVLYSKMASS